MKKKIILLFIVGLLFVVGCGKKEVKHETQLSSFLYSYSKNGTSCTITINTNDNGAFLTSYGNNTNCSKDNIKLSDEQLKELEIIINDNNVKEWDGFGEKDKIINNGDEFSIQIGYDDGVNIFAYGYMKFPENYSEVHNAFIKLFNEIK